MLVKKSKPQLDSKWWLKSVPEVNTWSDINVLRFLRLYQSHPMLWNVNYPEYKNVCSRLRAYKHIVDLLQLRGVDEEECMKLVERLKKKYVEEKEARGRCDKRPAWFEIIGCIVRRILNDTENSSFEACKQCCSKQEPCQSESTVSSDFQACKDCCADQNLDPPCKYYESSETDEESGPCNFQNVECYTICDEQVKVVFVSFGDAEDLRRNSDCSCKSDSLTNVASSSDSIRSCDCTESKSSISSESNMDFCNQHHRTPIASSTSLVDEKSAGIFMDSLRFRGKRISLVDDYVRNERGKLQLVEPRLHLARCCCYSDFYPLQVEL